MKLHPLAQFTYCPICGQQSFVINNEKSKRCTACGFVYYFNPSAAVASFIKNKKGELLIVRRGKEPAKGTLDLPGGFTDCNETAEEATFREIREETGLVPESCRYLFSLPNIYLYSGFNVHTMDLFFECEVPDFAGAKAEDDAAEIIIMKLEEISADDFGLDSVRKAVAKYKENLSISLK